MNREISLRPAHPSDAIAVATVHVRSWQTGYKDLLPKQYLDNLNPEERAKRYDFACDDITKPRTFVAVETTAILGFVTIILPNGVEAHYGELNALYVDPDHWRRGIGTKLLEYALSRLTMFEINSAVLWVLKDNARAMRFYEKQGWVASNHSKTDRIWGIDIEELQYRYDITGNSI